MWLILRQAFLLVLAVAAAYLVLLAASLLVMRPEKTGEPLEAGRAPDTLYMTQPKYVFMARSGLDTPTDKLLLVGASNTMAGFRRKELQPLLPDLEVHNVSVGGSNLTQMAQVVDLIREVQSPQARRRDVYVIGLWYGVFASDTARWHVPGRTPGDTDIDIERYRYGFYRRGANGPVPVLPPSWLDTGAVLVHPFLVLDRLARDGTRGLRGLLGKRVTTISDEVRNAAVIGPQRQREYLAFWREYTGGATTLEAAQFAALRRIVDDAVSDGARVLLVDLPIPAWHTEGSALAADYRRQLDALLPQLLAKPGVQVLDMTDASSPDDFSDEVHPKPRVTPRWAARLAQAVQAVQGQAAAAPPRPLPPGGGRL